VGPGTICRSCGISTATARRGPGRSRCLATGCCSCPGRLLQGVGLAFDIVVHLRVTPAARRRRTAPDLAWELAAFDRYDDEVDPAALADAVVLADHPDRPALVLGGRFLS